MKKGGREGETEQNRRGGEEEGTEDESLKEGDEGVRKVKGESWMEQLKLMQITAYGGKQIHLIV